MFFVFSKIFGFVTTPSNFAALLCLLGLLLLVTEWRVLASRLIVSGVVLLLLFGFSPLGNVLLLTLSERFPAWHDTGRVPDGIIVLGGAINPELSAARGTAEINASGERMTAAVELARRFPSARIVLTGGNNSLIHPVSTEAFAGAQFLESLGVAHDRIVLEDRARTTAENAIFTRDLLKPRPGEYWLLVTSAMHMPRAMGVFRAAGFDVAPYPVDWRTRGWRDAGAPFDTLSGGLSRMDTAVHEWIGLIGYRLSGRSRELLPGPQ
ncbi:MAG: YdcF family protein [Bradyrhizobiaceae bacterium]|nr:MAG: YdcF family protein [Bradyrhizobiaceae bacterium]